MNVLRKIGLSFLILIFLSFFCLSSTLAGQLHDAAMYGDEERAKRLITQGANINAKDIGFTPLHWAALKGHKDMIEMLIKYGADINMKGVFGWGALELSVSQGYMRIAEILRLHGAKGDENMLNEMAKILQKRLMEKSLMVKRREFGYDLWSPRYDASKKIAELENRLPPAALFYVRLLEGKYGSSDNKSVTRLLRAMASMNEDSDDRVESFFKKLAYFLPVIAQLIKAETGGKEKFDFTTNEGLMEAVGWMNMIAQNGFKEDKDDMRILQNALVLIRRTKKSGQTIEPEDAVDQAKELHLLMLQSWESRSYDSRRFERILDIQKCIQKADKRENTDEAFEFAVKLYK